MLYEMRIYETVPGRLPALHDRFQHTTRDLFGKHGIRVVGYWTDLIGTSDRLIYIIAWESLAEREKKWTAFTTDPDWVAAKTKSEAAGPIVARIHASIMQPTAYSPLP